VAVWRALSLPRPAGRVRLEALGVWTLTLALSACGGTPEVAVQKAKVGELLVRAGDTRVWLAKGFQAGVPNGLYKGVVRVESSAQGSTGQLHQVSAVCSMKNLPGWPTYDNLYGNALTNVAEAGQFRDEGRWQLLYHFDGRTESSGPLNQQAWTDRLRDNLCRRGDFDDSKAKAAANG
jgi:hypothetical protein